MRLGPRYLINGFWGVRVRMTGVLHYFIFGHLNSPAERFGFTS